MLKPPADALSNPIYTPATVGAVGFVVYPVHVMAPHDMLLVVNVVFLKVINGEAFPCTCI